MRAGGEGEGGRSRCSVHPPTHGRTFAGMPHAHLTDYPFVPRGEWRRTRWAMGRGKGGMTTRHAASLRSLVEGAYDKCFGIPTGKAAARELRMLCVWGARREGGARTARRIHQRNGRMFAGMPEHHPS